MFEGNQGGGRRREREKEFCTDTLCYHIPLLGKVRLPSVTLKRCGQSQRLCEDLDWAQYPYYPLGTEIYFSKDEGQHLPYTTYPVEWWYANFHLTGDSEREYGAFVAFFRLPIPLGGMRLFAISDLEQHLTYTHPDLVGILEAYDNWLDLTYHRLSPSGNSHQLAGFGDGHSHGYQAPAAEYSSALSPFGVDRWYNKSSGGELLPFEYRLEVTGEDGGAMHLDVEMTSIKAPLMVGGDGIVAIGDDSSYYYSHTRVDVSGTMKVHGITEHVDGYAWVDHQWGDFLGLGHKVTWEWFSIQLEDSSEIMVADVWVNGERQGSFSGGLNLHNADCSTELFEHYTITQERFWHDPGSDKIFATEWTIEASCKDPARQIHLTVTADYENQVFPLTEGYIFTPRFWEGSCLVSGTIKGRPVSGKAYAELTHSWEGDSGPRRVLSDNLSNVPERFLLSQNYPNPFNAATTIYYQLPFEAHVKLQVYNLLGEKVITLVDEKQETGYKSIRWDASKVSSGLYFYRLTAGDFTETRRMILVK